MSQVDADRASFEGRKNSGYPKSCLSNWMNELGRWCPELRAVRLHGSREEREELLETVLRPRRTSSDREFDVCVTTYEIVNIERTTLSKHIWSYFVIDEAHRLKNDESLFSQSARDMLARHRLLLTGTPLQNNLHELWALLNFCTGYTRVGPLDGVTMNAVTSLLQ